MNWSSVCWRSSVTIHSTRPLRLVDSLTRKQPKNKTNCPIDNRSSKRMPETHNIARSSSNIMLGFHKHYVVNFDCDLVVITVPMILISLGIQTERVKVFGALDRLDGSNTSTGGNHENGALCTCWSWDYDKDDDATSLFNRPQTIVHMDGQTKFKRIKYQSVVVVPLYWSIWKQPFNEHRPQTVLVVTAVNVCGTLWWKWIIQMERVPRELIEWEQQQPPPPRRWSSWSWHIKADRVSISQTIDFPCWAWAFGWMQCWLG